MTGYVDIVRIRDITKKCEDLGFRIGSPEYAADSLLALYPKDSESLPIYRREAQLFVGTLETLEVWIRGLEWARNYDRMTIGESVVKTRARKEQDIRNKALIKILKE